MAMAGGMPSMASTWGRSHAVEEMARVGREGLNVPALSFGVQRIEDERGLARPAHPRDDDQLVDGNVEVEILEVVLARAANANRIRA